MVYAQLPDKLLFIRVSSVFIRGSITFFLDKTFQAIRVGTHPVPTLPPPPYVRNRTVSVCLNHYDHTMSVVACQMPPRVRYLPELLWKVGYLESCS